MVPDSLGIPLLSGEYTVVAVHRRFEDKTLRGEQRMKKQKKRRRRRIGVDGVLLTDSCSPVKPRITLNKIKNHQQPGFQR